MSESELPTSRLGRLARLAGASARVGMTALTGNPGDAAAKAAAETLGSLRGLAAKVGQMSAYVDGLVPEEHSAAYETWMKGLLSATPRSSTAAIHGVIEQELGAPVDRLFASFEPEPIASASIGQVHRAVLLDGTEVAVKVQHPGVAAAVESDLANAGLLEGVLSMMGGARKMETKRVLEEVRTRFREELDYRLEADRAEAFGVLHQGDPTIRIPRVFRERSATRVLTTEFVRGASFDEACRGSEAERQAHARTLWRFAFKGILLGGTFNADPHPGNYFFHEDGGVSFIDHGCVQPIPAERRVPAIAMHRAGCAKDEAAFRAAAREMLGLQGGTYEERALGYVRKAFEPLFGSPFHITRRYTAELVGSFREMAKDTMRGKEDDAVPLPEGMFFTNRLQFGFYSVCARLDVSVDYASVERDFLGA